MLVNLHGVLDYAKKHNCAIGAFNCATLESARAAVMAAEELGVPIILQHAGVHEEYISVELSCAIMLELAKESKLPICVHLDHGASYEQIVKAFRLGFTSVMYDASNKHYEQNIAETKQIVSLAHSLGITVEAELGDMPHNLKGEMTVYTPEDFYTKPSMAKRFVEETGVDALAISFGTVHGIYKTTPKLCIDVINKVRQATGDLPLVMHGGSGLTDDDYRNAINAGIRKINYYTYESLSGGIATQQYCQKATGKIFFHDIATNATQVMKQDVKRVIGVFLNK